LTIKPDFVAIELTLIVLRIANFSTKPRLLKYDGTFQTNKKKREGGRERERERERER
jgi:hypothetical protein